MSVSPLDDLFALDEEQVRCPFTAYRAARNEAPVHYSDRLGGYVVTRYEDVLEVLKSPERYSSRMASGPTSVTPLARKLAADPATPPELLRQVRRRLEISESAVLVNADPPLHIRQRKLVNKAFTARRVAGMEDEVRAIADTLIDRFVADGEVELVSQFCVGLPMTVIAAMLGVPPELRDTFKRWTNAFTVGIGAMDLSRGELTEMFQAVDEFYDYFTEQLESRRENPQDDLLSDVVAARVDGVEPLTLNEMLQMVVQLLVAGNETTTSLLGSIMWRLVQDEELLDEMRSDPSRIELLVEECLRLESPVQGLFRVANQDIELGGAAIPSGSLIWIAYGSANRDEQEFDVRDELTLDGVEARPHLAFGRGEHFCLGSGLARLEARVGITRLVERLPNVAFVGDPATAGRKPSFIMRGLRELPLRFDATA